MPGGAMGQHGLLMCVPADDRPGHARCLVLRDGGVEQLGDGVEHGGRDNGDGVRGLRHGRHSKAFPAPFHITSRKP